MLPQFCAISTFFFLYCPPDFYPAYRRVKARTGPLWPNLTHFSQPLRAIRAYTRGKNQVDCTVLTKKMSFLLLYSKFVSVFIPLIVFCSTPLRVESFCDIISPNFRQSQNHRRREKRYRRIWRERDGFKNKSIIRERERERERKLLR